MGLTKAQLEALNITSFPDNTTGLITPTILRDYNTASIENTVNQDVYTTDSASFKTSITNLNAATASYVTSAITASSLITASFAAGTLTFTKGNGTTFGVAIPDISGSTIPAGTVSGSAQIVALGFATTGSNTFIGNQIISGAIQSLGDNVNNVFMFRNGTSAGPGINFESIDAGINLGSNGTLNVSSIGGSNSTLKINTPGNNGNANLNFDVSGIGGNDIISISARGNNNTASLVIEDANSNIPFILFEQNPVKTTIYNKVDISGSLDITGSLSASLNQGYVLVGDSNNRTQLVATSSFGSTINTGSFVTTDTTQTITAAKTFQNTIGMEGVNNSIQFGSFDTNRIFSSGGKNITLGAISSDGANSVNLTAGVSGSASNFGADIINIRTLSNNTGNNILLESRKITLSGSIQLIGALSSSNEISTSANIYAANLTGSTINTGSFATTGSNTFFGPQFISGAYYGDYTSSNQPAALIVSGGIFPYGDNMFDIGSDEHSFNKIVVNGELKGSSLNTTSRGKTGTMGFIDETFPLGVLTDREIIAQGSGVNTHMYYATSSANINGLREFAYVPSGSPTTPDMNILSASFASTISSIVTGTGFATTGSNTFTGNQTISTAGNTQLNLIAQPGLQTNVDFQSENSNFRAFGDFSINNNGQGGGSGSIKMLTKDNFMILAADQGFRMGVTDGIGSAIDNSGFVTINVPSGSQQFQLTGSLVVSNTLTASLAQGYAWVGGASNISTLVATSSFGGGSTSTGSLLVTASFASNDITFTKGDASTFNLQGFATTGSNSFRGVENIGDISGTGQGEVYLLGRSGSLIIGNSVSTPTYAALAHLSSSQINANTNLIFKPNSNAGTTIISGSSNIFTNPSTPTTGYIRYIGGSNNLYLNSTNGINSQITASAVSVSGSRPTMNNNIFNGTGNFSINQATNPGTHTYGQNIITGTGTTTINALGFTGSLNLLSNFNNNGTITINAASASVAEITSGLSGSGTINVNNNGNFGGTITATSPRTLLTTNTQNINSNILAAGAVTVTNISSSAQVSANNNIGASSFTYSNAGAAGLGLHTTAGAMSNNYGAMSLIASASAIQATNNISPASMAVTNRMYSGSLGLGVLNFNNNQTQGASNTYTVSGSFGGTTGNPGATMQANGIFGASNTIFTNVEGRGNYVDVRNNLIGGTFLILTGSNNLATTGSGGGYFGRFNADDGLRNGTGENIFFVGTGTSATTRKTGFLIDSGSNTFVEGTLNVSGSTTMTGSLILSSSAATELIVIGNSEFTGSVKVASTFQLQLPTGSNQQAGTAVLDGGNPGTVTVSNSLVTANSIIMVSKQTLTNAHMVAVTSKGAGTFTITSNGNGDADTVGWFIINNS